MGMRVIIVAFMIICLFDVIIIIVAEGYDYVCPLLVKSTGDFKV